MRRARYLWTLIVALALVTAAFIWGRPIYRGVLYEAMADACSTNNYGRVELLLRLGADPDGSSDYSASLPYQGFEFTSHVHRAITHPDLRILRLLVARGAHPDISIADGATPLVCAVHDHQPGAVQVLLAAGANPRYKPTWTAADQARKLGHNDLVPIIEPYLNP
jgi:hypothetical protein